MVQAAPTLQSKIVATTSISGDVKAVDVTTNGTVFANVDSDVYRSVDAGVTWTKVLDRPSGFVYFLRVDSQDRIFSASYNSTGGTWHNDVWLSQDFGATWTLVISAVPKVWRLTELSNGTLFINSYATGYANVIYQSDDGGVNWFVCFDLTSWGNDHVHFVRVNPYNNDIWVGLGDKNLATIPTVARSQDDGSTWTFLYNTTSDWMYTDVIFDSAYAYLLPDRSASKIQRLPHRGVWADKIDVFNIGADDYTVPSGIAYSMMGAVYDDGLMIVPTDRETVYASVDGVRWLKIFQTTYGGSGGWRLDYVSQRRDVNGYWYFINDYTDTVYRATVTAVDFGIQFGVLHNEYFGAFGNETMQIPVENDTRISLNITSQPVGTKFQVSAIGLTKGNFISNPSFETGNLTGWTMGGDAAGYAVTNVDKYDGTYSLQINKTIADSGDFWIQTPSPISLYDYSEYWFAFSYIKANETGITAQIEVGYYANGVWTLVGTRYSGVQSTSWTKRTTIAQRSQTLRQVYVRFIAQLNPICNYTIYFDTTLLERKVSNYRINKVNNGDTIVYKTDKSTPTASTALYGYTETKDVNITLSSYTETISYVGNLSEGARKDYFYTLNSFIFDIYVRVGGSKQILLIVTYSYPTAVYGATEMVLGAAIIAGTATALAWLWRRKRKTRTVSVPP